MEISTKIPSRQISIFDPFEKIKPEHIIKKCRFNNVRVCLAKIPFSVIPTYFVLSVLPDGKRDVNYRGEHMKDAINIFLETLCRYA